MTRRRVVYQRPDGHLSVVVPSPRYVAHLMSSGMTEAGAIAAIRAKDVPPDAADPVECDQDDIPADRTFRDAWRRDGTHPVRIDMPAARAIHRQRLEQRAAERGRQLREDYLAADEDGDTTRVAQLKGRIRGMRQRIAALNLDDAQTPEDLAAITDEEIGPVYPGLSAQANKALSPAPGRRPR